MYPYTREWYQLLWLMERIRDLYKDDKMKLQQEMLQLYRKEKINPAAGCLPIFMQIPVFFALYKVLFVSIEMRQAPFFGWISDLAAPDPTSIFNLFGLLPYSLPVLLTIGVWPCLMGLSMWLQQQLNPQAQQKANPPAYFLNTNDLNPAYWLYIHYINGVISTSWQYSAKGEFQLLRDAYLPIAE
jgi:YidC/Oxa1 family membrane protein insertase